MWRNEGLWILELYRHMELYLELWQIFICKSLQMSDWHTNSSTPLSMDLEKALVKLSTKSFFWMTLHDRVNTRNLLRRKTFYLESYNYALRNCQQEETLFHLFWGCPFAAQCWDFVCPNRDVPVSYLQAAEDVKTKLNVPFSMEVLILATWAIWITRNNFISQQIHPSFQRWKDTFFWSLIL